MKSVFGPGVELLGASDLEQAPAVHDADAVGQLERLVLIVGHEDGGDAEPLLDLVEGCAGAASRIFTSSAPKGSSRSSTSGS